MVKSARSRGSSTRSKHLLELEEFMSDDGKHHVIWHDGGSGYPIWWCDTHKDSYFLGCSKSYKTFDLPQNT